MAVESFSWCGVLADGFYRQVELFIDRRLSSSYAEEGRLFDSRPSHSVSPQPSASLSLFI